MTTKIGFSTAFVAEADPQKFVARVLPKGLCRTSPVLANGRVYPRNAAAVFAGVDVGGKQTREQLRLGAMLTLA